jgi:hypothetical protein
MTVETATYIHELNALLPDAADGLTEGDNHIRLLKSALDNTFPNFAGAVTKTHTQINNLQETTTALAALAALTPADGNLVAFSGASTAELIPVSDFAKTILDDAAASNVRTTLGLGALAVLATVPTASIDDDAVTFAKMQNITTSRLLGRTTASSGNVEEISVGTGLALAAGILSASSTIQVLIYQDQKTNGTGGGTPATGARTKRTCDDLVVNTTSISHSSSVFTVPVGKWLIFSSQTFYNVTGGYAHFIRNVTDGADIAKGHTGDNTGMNIVSPAFGYLDVTAGTKNVQLEYYSATAAANGLGLAVAPGSELEVYSTICFVKIG